MVPKTVTKPKVSAIIGHGVHEHYALYNIRYENGAEDVKLELDIPESQNLLDAYKQSVDPQNLSANGVYVVEKILNHRKVSGKTLFLVQWAGFENPIWNSELTRAGLKNSEGVVLDYLKLLEKPKKATRVRTARGNRKASGAKADAESDSCSDSEESSSDSDAKPSTSKRARDSSSGSSSGSEKMSKRAREKGQLMVDEKKEDSGEESDESEHEDEDVDDEEVEEENRDDDDGESDGGDGRGMEMVPETDDDDEDGPIVEHPDDNDDGEGEDEVRDEAVHDGGAEQRRQVRLWNHRWHQYHVLQFEMEYANRFFITYGFPPLYIPQYDPNGSADLVPPEHEPYAEEPEEDEQ